MFCENRWREADSTQVSARKRAVIPPGRLGYSRVAPSHLFVPDIAQRRSGQSLMEESHRRLDAPYEERELRLGLPPSEQNHTSHFTTVFRRWSPRSVSYIRVNSYYPKCTVPMRRRTRLQDSSKSDSRPNDRDLCLSRREPRLLHREPGRPWPLGVGESAF